MTAADPLADLVFALLAETASRHPKELAPEEKASPRLWDAILALRARVTHLECEDSPPPRCPRPVRPAAGLH